MLKDIKKVIGDFRNRRNWLQFHSPKNLSMAIAIESGELMEHFQWLDCDESIELINSDSKQAILDELADVLIYCINMADIFDVEIEDIILDKLAKNNVKYPVEEYKNRF